MNELDRSKTMNELDRLETDLTLAMAQVVAMTEAMIEAEANIDAMALAEVVAMTEAVTEAWEEAIKDRGLWAKTIKAGITRIEARIAALKEKDNG